MDYGASQQANSGFWAGYSFFWLIFVILVVVGLWKTFQKAGKPGWGAIIPIYNLYLIIKIAGKPGWWLILYFIPIVNIVINILVSLNFAKAFGRSTAFGLILIWLFMPIGALILGFGKSKYVGAPK